MSDDNSKERCDAGSRLEVLRKRQEELRYEYDDQIRWLREIAPRFCDTEDQQRTVGDIDELRRKLIKLEKQIWKLENPSPDL